MNGLVLAVLFAVPARAADWNDGAFRYSASVMRQCKTAAADLAALQPPADLSQVQMRLAAEARPDASKFSEYATLPPDQKFIRDARHKTGLLANCGQRYAQAVLLSERTAADINRRAAAPGLRIPAFVQAAVKEYNAARDELEAELVKIGANPVVQAFAKSTLQTFYLVDQQEGKLPLAVGSGAADVRAAAQLQQDQDTARASGMKLTQADLDKMIVWMQHRAAAANVDYCYKRTYGRGAGYVLSACGDGMQKNGALCYPECRSGYGGAGPVCWQNCPTGYVDTGAFCHIDKKLTREGSWSCPHWWSCRKVCPAGYTNAGLFCALTTPSNPPGWKGDGLDLTKDSYTRGAGTVLSCTADQEQNGALCYPKCSAGYYGEGPLCWQSCYGGQTDCAAGCAKDKATCGMKTADMVIAPIMLAVNVLTLGGSSEVSAARAEVTASLKAGDKAAAKAAFGRMLELYADNIAKMTSEDIAKKLEEKFAKDAARWVAKEYVKIQYYLATKKDDAAMAESMARDLAGLDPTGVAQTVEAYTQPKCALDEPMPDVTPL